MNGHIKKSVVNVGKLMMPESEFGQGMCLQLFFTGGAGLPLEMDTMQMLLVQGKASFVGTLLYRLFPQSLVHFFTTYFL